ncbi:GntR family transcriptional regulator [Risungbinella massiliensis]|uniref:GntR family transcriptional regulator n=1 Tax=Risungbinella massiliensis TaxID=1329796 RepID=UPI0005CC8001|nr:GntR family transcriptional regulator [Risungbinella massiliensis]
MDEKPKTRWEQIYLELRDQIITGVFQPGSEFPTNAEFMRKYDVHSTTIQSAINALINDGLVLSQGKKAPRIVRKAPTRARYYRKGGFSSEFGNVSSKNILALQILQKKEEIPESLQQELSSPVLFYHTEQFLNQELVAVSKAYIPNHIPIRKLHKLMKQAGGSLYGSLEYLGFKPTSCEEIVTCDFATSDERKELRLPKNSNTPVVRIIRKTFDANKQLVEICPLVYRADLYEFAYQFDF